MEEVVTTIEWADDAKTSFDNIIRYLESEWTEKEIAKFIARTEEVLHLIRRYPEMNRPSLKQKNARLVIINKHAKLAYFYKPGKNLVTLLLFWSMKQDPSKIKY